MTKYTPRIGWQYNKTGLKNAVPYACKINQYLSFRTQLDWICSILKLKQLSLVEVV